MVNLSECESHISNYDKLDYYVVNYSDWLIVDQSQPFLLSEWYRYKSKNAVLDDKLKSHYAQFVEY